MTMLHAKDTDGYSTNYPTTSQFNMNIFVISNITNNNFRLGVPRKITPGQYESLF